MKKIIIFGLNFEQVQEVARSVSKKLNLKFLNASNIFNKTLLESANDPVLLIDDELNEQESLLCQKLAAQDDVVVAMSDDMFLSNENYKNFKNFTKILLKTKTSSKIKQNIENLLQSHSTITSTTLDEILEKLKGTI